MDEINELNHNEYAYLRQLPIDKLLELLAAAPVLSACSEDEAYVDALEEAIIEKENENSTGFFPDVDQQWEHQKIHFGLVEKQPSHGICMIYSSDTPVFLLIVWEQLLGRGLYWSILLRIC